MSSEAAEGLPDAVEGVLASASASFAEEEATAAVGEETETCPAAVGVSVMSLPPLPPRSAGSRRCRCCC